VAAVLEGCSDDARIVVSQAIAEARQLGHSRVGTEHLLLGLLAEEDSEPAVALRAAGATLAAARYTVAEIVTDVGESPSGHELPFTARAQRALERAGRFSRRFREPEVTAEHVLLGLLDVEGLACQVMRGLGVDISRLQESLVPTHKVAPAAPPAFEEQERPAALRPECPGCRAGLDGNLLETVIAARGDGESTTNVSVAYCAICGVTLGALRAEPS
jgi:ATP-dependent Clp protease ATP-binding subunit ClpA